MTDRKGNELKIGDLVAFRHPSRKLPFNWELKKGIIKRIFIEGLEECEIETRELESSDLYPVYSNLNVQKLPLSVEEHDAILMLWKLEL
jgi:hypothetical protein